MTTKDQLIAARDDLTPLTAYRPDHFYGSTRCQVDCALFMRDHIDTIRAVLDDALATISKEETVGEEKDYTSPLRPKRLEYTMCGKIYAVQDNGERHMFMDVRGWGYLTGGGAKKLPYEEAASIQDKWAQEVVELWNTRAEPQVVDVEGLKNETFKYLDNLFNNPMTIDQGVSMEYTIKYITTHYTLTKRGV